MGCGASRVSIADAYQPGASMADAPAEPSYPGVAEVAEQPAEPEPQSTAEASPAAAQRRAEPAELRVKRKTEVLALVPVHLSVLECSEPGCGWTEAVISLYRHVLPSLGRSHIVEIVNAERTETCLLVRSSEAAAGEPDAVAVERVEQAEREAEDPDSASSSSFSDSEAEASSSSEGEEDEEEATAGAAKPGAEGAVAGKGEGSSEDEDDFLKAPAGGAARPTTKARRVSRATPPGRPC
jgi:hypothetical protein